MIKTKQGWIFAEAEFIKERDLMEKIQEKKQEIVAEKKFNELMNKDDEVEESFSIYPEDLTPVYRQVRFLKEDVRNYKECIEDQGLTEVTFKFDDDFFVVKATIEEFDKVFFD